MLSKNFVLNKKSISLLSTRGLPLPLIKSQIDNSIDSFLALTYAQGLDIIRKKGLYYFNTKFMSIEDAEYCIVDIEANGSNLEKHQIIEIAAIKVKNSKIIDRYESLVFVEEINPIIVELTGISAQDTIDAPELSSVLMEFKLFLGDAIFVAHDVKFDYNYISDSMKICGLEPLLNRSICSLGLAQRTIVSYKYSISYLNEAFNFNPNATHHRAMSDVMTTYGLFLESLENCKESLNNVEDLIKFSKEGKRLKRPKIDPFLEEEMKKK